MRRNRTTRTLHLGLPQFIDKAGYQAQVYARHGESIRYVVPDANGQSFGFAVKYNADIRISSGRILGKIWTVLKSLMSFRPDNVELCLTGRMAWFYALLAKLTGRNLIVFLRGMELRVEEPALRSHRAALRMADVIIAKDFTLLKEAVNLGLGHKTRLLHNCVPAVRHMPAAYEQRDVDVVYINTPRRMRNVLFLIDVIDELLRRRPDLKVALAGFAVLDSKANLIEPDYEREVLSKIRRMGLEGRIRLLGFISNAPELMARSKVFVLPADSVYCNHSLLESMSNGCVPVVSDAKNADLIVKHGKNGMISPLSIKSYADAIEMMLRPDTWRACSKEAIDTIEKNFSIDSWYHEICRIRSAAGLSSNSESCRPPDRE